MSSSQAGTEQADAAPRMTAAQHFNAAAHNYEKFTGGCTRELARCVLALPQLLSLRQNATQATVLDNACGSGIVAEEILLHYTRSGGVTSGLLPRVCLIDAAPNMIDVARSKLTAMTGGDTAGRLEFSVMPGEKIGFPDAFFTHSITNVGLMFFSDPAVGVQEIFRTLAPGGVAVVTSWADLGYVDNVIRPAQKTARPKDAPYEVPIPSDWSSPLYVRQKLAEGGFSDVTMSEHVVHCGASSCGELRDLFVGAFRHLWKDWQDEEKATFSETVLKCVETVAVKYTMNDGEPGVGVPMRGLVAVCMK